MPGRLPTSLILLLTVFACGQSATTPCGDGLSCPTFLVCAPLRGECVDEGAMRACAGVPEGGECLDGGELGVCDQGVCVAAACGDGFLTSPEECDDGNLTAGDGCNECLLESCGNGLVEPSEECDCGDFEHPSPACLSRNSDQPGAQCRTDCRNHCGDGVINLAESCEPAMAADQCVAFGFDHGAVACAACRQSFERCGRIGFRHVDGNVGFATTTDIWLSDSGTGFLSMTSIGPIGVAVTFSAHDLSRSYSQLGFRAHAVWGRSAADVYAVGGYFPSAVGGIAHFDGSTWTDLASVPVAPFFLSIWGDDQELLVGGFSGALWRLENDVWTDLSNGDVRNIAVVKTAAGAIVAGGCLPSQGQCLGRFRWRSAAEVWGPAIATPDDRIIRALWTDGEEVLAVGDGGLFCRVEAASCVPEDLNTSVALRDIAGPSRDNLWVVGDADTALHFFGGEWRRVVTGAPNDWVGVAVNSSGAVALASALQGVIGGAFAVADGRSYFFESGPTALGLPRGVYAPDDSGAMIVGDNLSSGAYTLRNGVKTDAGFPAGVLPLAIWGRSWTDIYVVGYAASRLSVQHYDGNT